MTEPTLCPLEHRNDPERPRRATFGVLCTGHYRGLADDLASLPGLHDTLAAYLVRSGGGDGGRSTDSDAIGIDLSKDVVKARDNVRQLLVSWAVIVLEEGPWQVAPDDTPRAIARWLLQRLPWLAQQPWVDELAANARTTVREARAQVQPNTTYRVELGPCPELLPVVDQGDVRLDPCPGTVVAVMRKATSREQLPSAVLCTAHGEDEENAHAWSPMQWHALGRRMGRSAHASAAEAFLRAVSP